MPILPVGLTGTKQLWLRRRLTMRVGKPISPAEFEQYIYWMEGRHGLGHFDEHSNATLREMIPDFDQSTADLWLTAGPGAAPAADAPKKK